MTGKKTQNGEQACEVHGYDEKQCAAVGCCLWDAGDGKCWSGVDKEACPSASGAGGASSNANAGGPRYLQILVYQVLSEPDGKKENGAVAQKVQIKDWEADATASFAISKTQRIKEQSSNKDQS